MVSASSAAQWLVTHKLIMAPPLSQVEASGVVVGSKNRATASSQGRLLLEPLRQGKGRNYIPMKPTIAIFKNAPVLGIDSIKGE